MTDLATALRDRISALEDEREELEDALNRVTARIGVLEELLVEECGEEGPAKPAPKKRGRPKGSKNKPKAPAKRTTKKKEPEVEDDPVLQEAMRMEGTDPEIAERLSKRKFTPVARPDRSYGPGIHPGVAGPAGADAPGVGDDEPVSGQ